MDDFERIRELEFSSDNLETELQAIEEREDDIAEMLSTWDEDAKDALYDELEKLNEQKEKLLALKEKNSAEIQSILEESNSSGKSPPKTRSVIRQVVATPITGAANAVRNTVSSGARNLANKANPFSKPINQREVTDSGAEALRLAHTGIKKGTGAIKTVRTSIKTTQRTIKTTGNVVRTTGRIVYRTATYTAKATVKTAQIAGTVVSHVVATLMNPVVLVIAGIVVILLLCIMLVVLMLGGGASSAASNQQAHIDAVGLVDIPGQYQSGLDYWRIAVEKERSDFYGLIDGLYYDYNDLPHSDLVYMVRVMTGSRSTYETSFATDGQKNTLKSAWQIPMTAQEAIAIAYVYLEKTANAANGSEMGIYEVTFTQETFNTIADKCILYTDSQYANQRCPNQNCTRHVETTENPAYTTALEQVNVAAAAYNSWLEVVDAIYQNSLLSGMAKDAQWWGFVQPKINSWVNTYNRTPTETSTGRNFLTILGSEYEAAMAALNATPANTEQITYICSLEHQLHSIGLSFYSADYVMYALGFTNDERQWVALTMYGFANNPNL